MDGTTTMLDLAPAAEEIERLLPAIRGAQLGDLTPASYSVATLLDHLLGLSVAFTGAARKLPDPVPQGPSPDADALPADWREQLPRALRDLVEAWRDPDAWQGTTTVAGATLPAQVMAHVALDELVIHGWDLARGTGQEFRCDPISTEVVLAFTAATAEPGREAERDGLFGPVVEVADDATALDRALGFAGRSPRWRPSR